MKRTYIKFTGIVLILLVSLLVYSIKGHAYPATKVIPKSKKIGITFKRLDKLAAINCIDRANMFTGSKRDNEISKCKLIKDIKGNQ